MYTKYQIAHLGFEVTRRCNMRCDFCVRGEPQDIDLNTECLIPFLQRIESIGHLYFSGGEPSLKPQVILEILKILELYKIQFTTFFIATNGIQIGQEFIDACDQLWDSCLDQEGSNVLLSFWGTESLPFKFCHKPYFNNASFFTRNGYALPVFGEEYVRRYKTMINEGRQRQNFNSGEKAKIDPIRIDNNVVRGMVYVNNPRLKH